MSAPPTLTVLSLGGGVQSSRHGAHGRRGRVRPRTGLRHLRRHPISVYGYVEWLEGQLRYPLEQRGQRVQ